MRISASLNLAQKKKGLGNPVLIFPPMFSNIMFVIFSYDFDFDNEFGLEIVFPMNIFSKNNLVGLAITSGNRASKNLKQNSSGWNNEWLSLVEACRKKLNFTCKAEQTLLSKEGKVRFHLRIHIIILPIPLRVLVKYGIKIGGSDISRPQDGAFPPKLWPRQLARSLSDQISCAINFLACMKWY